MDQSPLKSSDILIMCSLTQTPGCNPDTMIRDFCINTGGWGWWVLPHPIHNTWLWYQHGWMRVVCTSSPNTQYMTLVSTRVDEGVECFLTQYLIHDFCINMGGWRWWVLPHPIHNTWLLYQHGWMRVVSGGYSLTHKLQGTARAHW